jgi:hypothetical protein
MMEVIRIEILKYMLRDYISCSVLSRSTRILCELYVPLHITQSSLASYCQYIVRVNNIVMPTCACNRTLNLILVPYTHKSLTTGARDLVSRTS